MTDGPVALATTTKLDPQPFEVRGPLPRGMTLLQASAGTGKTFTIAALTTRYVAEGGSPIDRLLVITFTRMATGELRERVRDRLVSAHDGLVDILAGTASHEDDEIVRLLADASRDETEARRDRLGKAIADFDAATIETTHGFCLQVLYGLGTAGDVDREVELVEDVRDLREEVVDDLYLRKFAASPNPLGFTRAQALEIAKQVLDHPDADLVPPWSNAADTPSIRRRFADAVRKEMARRKRNLKILTYDDILLRLRHTLLDPERGRAACARLRERYDVVLVDEFQDTDPVQWDIMHRAFGQGGATLVLIGDPKQAIYAFRGADVHAYLDAQEVVQSEWTLDENWRSDEGLLRAYDALFADAQLGSAGITYRSISAAPPNRAPRLDGDRVGAPLRVRVVHAGDGLVAVTKTKGQPQAHDARNFIARDLATEVVKLLEACPEVVTRGRDGAELARTTLHPGHIAVLVRANSHALIVRDALHRAGVPAVIGGSGSVFGTSPALEWLRLLEALERPTARDRAALAALTCFIGWTADEVAGAGEDDWEELHWSLHRWAALLRDEGIASLYEAVSRSHGVPERVLTRESGERDLTDLRHIAQLLHEAGVSEGLGPTAMATWLGRRIRDASRDTENEERARRLESDADAVQVITIHRSKGLEFPVVLCPYMWDGRPNPSEVPVFHDAANGNRRTIDVGREGNDFAVHQKQELDEERGEDLRLLYVALTRARHQAFLWWVGVQDSQHSPLARLLFERDAQGLVHAYGSGTHTDDEIEAAFRALGPEVSVERVAEPAAVRWQHEERVPPELESAVFDRRLDLGWRRVSYSGITRALHEEPVVGSEPERQLTTDEDLAPFPARGPATRLRSVGALARRPARPGRHARRRARRHGGAQRLGTDGLRRTRSLRRGRRGPRPRVGLAQRRSREPRRRRRRTLRRHREPARCGRRRPATPRSRTAEPARRAGVRDPARRRRRPDGHAGRRPGGRRARRTPRRRRPGRAVRRPAPRPCAQRGSPRLPHREPGPGVPRRRRPLRPGRLQDEQARLARRGLDRLALPARSHAGGDGGRALSAAGLALLGRPAPLSALEAPALRARAPSRRGLVPLRAGDERAGTSGVRRVAVRSVVLAPSPATGGVAQRPLRPWRFAVTPVEGPDAFDVTTARRASGPLRTFNQAGILSPSDVHVALRLARLGGTEDDAVVLGTAFAARAPRLGHVCVDLQSIKHTASADSDSPVDVGNLPWPEPPAWLGRLSACALVGADRPLHLEGSNLYLDRLWADECLVASELESRAAETPDDVDDELLAAGLARLFPGDDDPDLQRLAAAASVLRRMSVIAGGPGTGKTTTVARALALLHTVGDPGRPPLVALAAPTGKAAARLEASVRAEARQADIDPVVRERLEALEGATLHRLLGFSPGNRTRFRHNRTNRLPHDVVVVDETSMVSLSMMARLAEAVRPHARLILVGDPDQLASVEAGAVLGDIVGPAAEGFRMSRAARERVAAVSGQRVPDEAPAPAAGRAIGDGIVVLRRVHRFGGAIGELAEAVQRGDADAAVAVLRAGGSNVRWIPVDPVDPADPADAVDPADAGNAGNDRPETGDLREVRELAVASGRTVIEAARGGRAADAIAALGRFRLLCAHRRGPEGVATWMHHVENWLRAEVEGFATGTDWYAGRPLIVTENDYALQLYNGDTGVVVEAGAGRRLVAAFERGGAIAEVSPTRLAAVDTVYAMTVHKSQGSQFHTVAFLLPPVSSRVLTRELLYTAVTRAQERLIVVGTEEPIRSAIERPITRASGLRRTLWGEPG